MLEGYGARGIPVICALISSFDSKAIMCVSYITQSYAVGNSQKSETAVC